MASKIVGHVIIEIGEESRRQVNAEESENAKICYRVIGKKGKPILKRFKKEHLADIEISVDGRKVRCRSRDEGEDIKTQMEKNFLEDIVGLIRKIV